MKLRIIKKILIFSGNFWSSQDQRPWSPGNLAAKAVKLVQVKVIVNYSIASNTYIKCNHIDRHTRV